MKAFFCHEKTQDNNWLPVVYFDRQPLNNGLQEGVSRQSHEIGSEFLGVDGQSPEFSKLMKKYPLTIE